MTGGYVLGFSVFFSSLDNTERTTPVVPYILKLIFYIDAAVGFALFQKAVKIIMQSFEIRWR